MSHILPIAAAPFRHRRWGIFVQFTLASALMAANPSLTLQVSSETAPAGGFVQFKVYATAPALISSGIVGVQFDPSIFGWVTSASGFSATGDQLGNVFIYQTQATIRLASESGGLGQLPGMPIAVINVPVLPGAKPGTTSSITFTSTSGWQDPAGDTYAVTVKPGTFTVSGTLSVQSMVPGAGLLPAGTTLQLAGTGFDATTKVAVDGVSLSSTQIVSPQQMNITLAGAAEIAGRAVRLSKASGEGVEFFPSFTPIQETPDALGPIPPLLPPSTSSLIRWDVDPSGATRVYIGCVENPSASPVTLTYYFPGESTILTKEVVLGPFGQLTAINGDMAQTPGNHFYMSASGPIRVGEVLVVIGFNSMDTSFETPAELPTLPGDLGIEAQQPVTFDWQVGTPAPQPQTRSFSVYSAFPYSISLSKGAEQWLSVAQSSNPVPALTLIPNVSNVGPGSLTATVTLTEQLPGDLAAFGPVSQSFTVTLNADAQPILVGGSTQTFYGVVGLTAPAPIAIPIGGIGSAAFTAVVTTSNGVGWLSVSAPSGTTPASLMLTVDPAGLSAGTYTGDLRIQGPANNIDYPVTLVMAAAGVLEVDQPAISLSATQGQSFSPGSEVSAEPPSLSVSVAVSTSSGGSWLSVILSGPHVFVHTNISNLGPGTYNGSLAIVSDLDLATTVPVTLTVAPSYVAPPAELTVGPPRLTLMAPAGTAAVANLDIASASGPAAFKIIPGSGGPAFTFSGSFVAPSTIQVSATAPAAGTYLTTLTVSWNGGTATIPITLYAGPSPASPPQIATVVASGSMTAGPIAPGELITILGTGLANSPSFLQFNPNGKVAASLGGSQVLINGVAAPLIYASTGQLNAIVPYETASVGVASVQVLVNSLASGIWEPPAAASAPSVFTLNASGAGPGAILNADNSVNTPSNPAQRGSIVQIFATGGGQTTPVSSTGAIAAGQANLELSTMVNIGGVTEPMIYAGAAPGEVNGVVQINAIVPQGVTPGAAVPITVSVGNAASQIGATIAVD